MRLPESFLTRMRDLMGEEYDQWLESYEGVPAQGLRINPAKLTAEEWEKISPWEIRPVLWNPNGYYCEQGSRPAKDVYYYAGLYYVQEPSAMAPAAILNVKPGQRVLDLCAAPGGKSTELGAQMRGKGLLVSNDVSASRAKALLKNLEMAGITNACVTAEEPGRLAEIFGESFDKILVDAPCSGEGMFRKEPELIKSWQKKGPQDYVPLQREILGYAVRMLKPGGELVYSTCTFSLEEDEGIVEWALANMPEMELLPITLWEGASAGFDKSPVIRLFPHKVEGEGHFAALFRKREESVRKPGERTEEGTEEKTAESLVEKREGQTKYKNHDRKKERKREPADVRSLDDISDFLKWEGLLRHPFDRGKMMIKEDQVYLLPEGFDPNWQLRYLRTGLLLGSVKKGRFEPSQAAAMAMGTDEFAHTFSMKREDERVIRYLKGESLLLSEEEAVYDGWVLVCVDGFPLGWAKAFGQGLKNKYYPGWRWQ